MTIHFAQLPRPQQVAAHIENYSATQPDAIQRVHRAELWTKGTQHMDARLQFEFEVTAPVELATSATSQSDADAIVQAHSRLVQSIAWKVFARVGHRIDFDDLIQIGRVALIESAYVFVDRGGAKFASYATMRIRGAMIDELRRTATISRGAIRYRRQFDAARDALTDRLGRQPCEAEMAQHVEMSVSAYRAVEATTHGIEFAAIDEAYTDHNEWFADRSTPSAYSILEAERAQQAVALAIAKLPHREQLVLQLFFVEELSLADIGKVLDVGGARVCQIKKAALARLRAQLGGWATQ